jgi:energy-coupling factor transporter ATP-binding protein EcfA2
MNSIQLQSFGPIDRADITLGDMTILVGPQASGKSLFLQLLKLLIDKKHIRRTLEQYGFIWENKADAILERYFGEGMAGAWKQQTKVTWDGKPITQSHFLPKQRESIKNAKELLFYVPAQRVVCLQNGWPRFFTDYEDSVPYVLRHFSESLRLLMETSSGKFGEGVFPKTQNLKKPLRDAFNNSIFHDGRITLDKTGKKRLKLEVGESSIPFLGWSAGQKEFMPLLLSFYLLCPGAKTPRKSDFQYVVVEEPEMGLHPQAISAVLLQFIDLLSRGYKVIVSTHSPVLLEFAWAFRYLQEAKADKNSLYKLFDLKKSPPANRLLNDILEKKTILSYAFTKSAEGLITKDISSLDAGSDDADVAEWGGLSSFSSRAAEIISSTTAGQ